MQIHEYFLSWKTLFSDVEKEMSDYAELPDIPLKKAQLI
jgi:hypothetical protein